MALYIAASALAAFIAGCFAGAAVMAALARSLLTQELGERIGKLMASEPAAVDREFREASIWIGNGRRRAEVAPPKRFTVDGQEPPRAA